MYTKAASTGDTIDENFVKVTIVSGSKKGVVSNLAALKGKRLVAGVSAGQMVQINQFADSILVFQLKNDILKGDSIRPDDVIEVFRSSEKTSKNSLFPKTLLSKATAARDLRAKTVLSRRDLNIRHLILMASQAIARGQKLNASNVEVKPFYGILPSDTLYAVSDIKDMESIRTIRPNLPLRASDLRPSLMVKKGDSIILSSGSGLLSITTTMIALENGKLDQQINLLNPESNEKIRALITGSGMAKSLQSKK
jgi:flagella basal body P-ring formation protein FlgA